MRRHVYGEAERGKIGDLFDDRLRIEKLIRLLGNNASDTEIVGAARALDRTLADSGGLHALADFLKKNWTPPQSEPPPPREAWSPKPPPAPKFDWQILADRLLQYPELLIRSDRIDEVDFLHNMRRSRSCPTDKQWKWMGDIEARIPPGQRSAA
jgi:hypothetical protein